MTYRPSVDMDGLTAAQELAAKGIPVNLVSGHPDAEKIVLEHEPVMACISKPGTLKSLLRAIEQAVAGLRDIPRRPK